MNAIAQEPKSTKSHLQETACLCLLLILSLPPFRASGEIVITASDIPSHIGTVSLAYTTTNVDLSSWLPKKGINQFWDFSGDRRADESTQELTLVPPNDGGNGGDFPNSDYAERVIPSDGCTTWSYFSIDPILGRNYYGFYDPCTSGGSASVPFSSPTVDLPTPIKFGSRWNRIVDYHGNVNNQQFFNTHVIVDAMVDGSGSLVLPSIGKVQALRVYEVRTSQVSLFGTPLFSELTTNLYWLSPGIGKAVDLQVVSAVNIDGTPAAGIDSTTRLGIRTYLADGIPSLHPSLYIVRSGRNIQLKWTLIPSASNYEIEAATNPALGDWRLVDNVSTNSWKTSLSNAGKAIFFKIVAQP